MSVIDIKNTAGVRLARAHRSVERGPDIREVYGTIAKAVRNNPFQSPASSRLHRMRAIDLAIRRATAIGERVRENFRVSHTDHARMEKEFIHLKQQIMKLSSESHYPQTVGVVRDTVEGLLPVGTEDLSAARLAKIIDQAKQGKISLNNSEDLEEMLYRVSKGLQDGSLDPSINIDLEVPTRIFVPYPLVYTVDQVKENLELREEVIRAGTEDDEVEAVDLIRASVRDTYNSILNNPATSIIAHAGSAPGDVTSVLLD